MLWDSPFSSLLGQFRTHHRMTIRSATYVDDSGAMERLETQILLGDDAPVAEIDAVRRGDRLEVVLRVDQFRQRMSFFYDSRAIWSPGLVPMDRLSRLRPGMTWTWKVVDPIRGTPGLVRCQVLAAREVPWAGATVRAYVVEQHYGGLKTRSLVALDGTILRQEVPFGWTTYTVVRLPH